MSWADIPHIFFCWSMIRVRLDFWTALCTFASCPFLPLTIKPWDCLGVVPFRSAFLLLLFPQITRQQTIGTIHLVLMVLSAENTVVPDFHTSSDAIVFPPVKGNAIVYILQLHQHRMVLESPSLPRELHHFASLPLYWVVRIPVSCRLFQRLLSSLGAARRVAYFCCAQMQSTLFPSLQSTRFYNFLPWKLFQRVVFKEACRNS